MTTAPSLPTTDLLIEAPTEGVTVSGPAAPADRFVRPGVLWYVVNDGGLAALATLSVSSAAYRAAGRAPGLPSRRAVRRITAGLGALHLFESVYAYRSAKRAGLTTSARMWGIHTLFVGLPALGKLRASIRAAR